MSQRIIAPGRYKHYKGGEYTVLATATHEKTGEKLVIYQSQSDFHAWARPLEEFLGEVEVDGAAVRRFTPTSARPPKARRKRKTKEDVTDARLLSLIDKLCVDVLFSQGPARDRMTQAEGERLWDEGVVVQCHSAHGAETSGGMVYSLMSSRGEVEAVRAKIVARRAK